MIKYILPISKEKTIWESPISNLNSLELLHYIESNKSTIFMFKSKNNDKIYKLIVEPETPLIFFNHQSIQEAKQSETVKLEALESNTWILRDSDFGMEMHYALTFLNDPKRIIDEYYIVTENETIRLLDCEPEWEEFDIKDLKKEIKKILDFELTDEF